MRTKLVDGIIVTAVATATAVFLGVGGPSVQAGGEGPPSEPPLAAGRAPTVELAGCALSAIAGTETGPSGQETVVTIRGRRPGSVAAEVHLLVGAERKDLEPQAALRRVIREDDFVTTRVAEKDVRLEVRPDRDTETCVRLGVLPPGAYTITAGLVGEDGPGVSLASLRVAEPKAAEQAR